MSLPKSSQPCPCSFLLAAAITSSRLNSHHSLKAIFSVFFPQDFEIYCQQIPRTATNFLTISAPLFCSAYQSSYRDCWLSQPSAEVSNAIERRTAISGLIPARPLSIALNVFRLTPRASAASVTDRPSGSRHSSLIISPGCGGLCMSILFIRVLLANPVFAMVMITNY